MDYTLITGATSDIGIQICKTMEESGHCLLLTDLSEEALLAARKQLKKDSLHLVLSLDLSNVESSREKLTQFIGEKSIHIVSAVFAAGIFAVKPLKMIDYNFLKKSFDIALFSIFSICQALTSKKTNGTSLESIVMISSVNSKIGSKGFSAYGAVKSAMLGTMKSLAVELAPQVRVNAVLPGAIRTRTTSFIFNSQEGSNPRYLLGEGQCNDIANAIAFLLSDKARWITGQEIIVDGGLTAN